MIDLRTPESTIERAMELHKVPGFAVAIVEGSDVAYARGFGVTSVEATTTPADLYSRRVVG